MCSISFILIINQWSRCKGLWTGKIIYCNKQWSLRFKCRQPGIKISALSYCTSCLIQFWSSLFVKWYHSRWSWCSLLQWFESGHGGNKLHQFLLACPCNFQHFSEQPAKLLVFIHYVPAGALREEWLFMNLFWKCFLNDKVSKPSKTWLAEKSWCPVHSSICDASQHCWSHCRGEWAPHITVIHPLLHLWAYWLLKTQKMYEPLSTQECWRILVFLAQVCIQLTEQAVKACLGELRFLVLAIIKKKSQKWMAVKDGRHLKVHHSVNFLFKPNRSLLTEIQFRELLYFWLYLHNNFL